MYLEWAFVSGVLANSQLVGAQLQTCVNSSPYPTHSTMIVVAACACPAPLQACLPHDMHPSPVPHRAVLPLYGTRSELEASSTVAYGSLASLSIANLASGSITFLVPVFFTYIFVV